MESMFLSYCKKDESIADIIEKSLDSQLGNRILISRYTREVGYKESFKEFMNSINEHDYILSIVSDNYLKSSACMYEVGEVLKNHNFTKQLLFVVLDEKDRKYYPKSYTGMVKADIYDPEKKVEYIKYWQAKYENLKCKIESIKSYEARRKMEDDLAAINKIMNFDIAPFMEYLLEVNGMTFAELKRNNFNEIIKCIFPGYNNDIFKECDTYEKLFDKGVKRLQEISKTDYNQIILYASIDGHNTGLVVVADIISEHKYRYRQVAVGGIIHSAYRRGETIIVNNVEKYGKGYFCAIRQTKSEVAVPIKIQGNAVGVINVESEYSEYFNEDKVIEIELLANLFGIALSKLGYDGISEKSILYIPFTLEIRKRIDEK